MLDGDGRRRSRSRMDQARGAQSESRARVRSSASIAPSISTRSAICSSVDVDVTAFLPPDTISHGFDNVADAQSVLADADGRLPARRQPDQPPGGRRSQRHGDVGHLQDPARGVADAPRRRRADGHARRHLGRCTPSRPTAHYVLKASLHYEPLGGLVGRNSMTALRPQRAGRVLGQRRARRAVRSQHAHERDRSEEQPRAA